MAKTPTICKNCANLLRLEVGTLREDVWYNMLCKASPLPQKLDVVSGKSGYSSKNDFGQEYIGDNPYKYCRDVNDGNCPKFYPKTDKE